jgi:NAD(P)-dependent dehydrogenase (short-subunit alcohol dehydrogenase family)
MLSQDGIQVVSVHPGPIATDMGREAGLEDIAEPPSLVADAIVDALSSGSFHAFPDSLAKQFGEAYASFAANIVEAQTANA